MLVLDANILIRSVLGKRVRQLLEKYTAQGTRFYAPDAAFADAEKYLPALLSKRGKPTEDLPAAIAYLRMLVESLSSDTFAGSEKAARERLRGRDEEDWPILAAALSLSCGTWTEDMDFSVRESSSGLRTGWNSSSARMQKHQSQKTNRTHATGADPDAAEQIPR